MAPGGGMPPGPSSGRPAPQPGPAGQQYCPPPGQPNRPASAMLIVDQSNRRFDLRTGSNVIGRGTESDLQLLDQGISRRHVDVQFDGNFATAYDLGSTNGTTVNGHEITSQMLRHGDVLRVGHTRLVFHQERV
jgi:pSer/pThr/pTyr-binding forkhead associated (FHA) protein